MAATKKPTTVETYRNIMSELKAGRFAPVYLLMGKSRYQHTADNGSGKTLPCNGSETPRYR